jgi:ribulose-5-phosphate 4-epimerase/fuculose-1-phosphate aldolase
MTTVVGDLVAANRILGHEGILDAYGHVSARDPGSGSGAGAFLLSRARAPQLVQEADLLEFATDGEPLAGGGRPLYLERYIHAAIYAARPDVGAVCHALRADHAKLRVASWSPGAHRSAVAVISPGPELTSLIVG